MKYIITALLLAMTLPAHANSEADYQDEWCKGQKEVVLTDRTRVDCITDTHAIELDFASNWKEAIGQSLHYSVMTGKKAGIVLIYNKPSDTRYLKQLERVIDVKGLDIRVWVIGLP